MARDAQMAHGLHPAGDGQANFPRFEVGRQADGFQGGGRFAGGRWGDAHEPFQPVPEGIVLAGGVVEAPELAADAGSGGDPGL